MDRPPCGLSLDGMSPANFAHLWLGMVAMLMSCQPAVEFFSEQEIGGAIREAKLIPTNSPNKNMQSQLETWDWKRSRLRSAVQLLGVVTVGHEENSGLVT